MDSAEKTSTGAIMGHHARILTTWRELPQPHRVRIAAYTAYVAAVTVLFSGWLAQLFAHAAQSDLHSHIPLVPVVAGYLLYLQPRKPAPNSSSMLGAIVAAAVGAAALLGASSWRSSLSVNDHLALITLAYLSFVVAGGFLFLGVEWLAAAAFPAAFLIFMIPLPDAVVYWLEQGSVLASAEAAAQFFNMTGTLMVRHGTIFELPGITLEVARECSGIRSSFVLFITSVLASHLFLKSGWRRAAIVAFVIPLGIIRNGFRILVIGLLCVHVGPHMIDSPVHHRGGPIFFVLSLVPFLLFLIWLRRGERQWRAVQEPAPADTR